jgi:hypothetical protein
MRTDKRTQETPWLCIDLISEETLGWYDTDMAALLDNRGKQVDTYYRPSRKKVVK